jgi:hypothetical protein
VQLCGAANLGGRDVYAAWLLDAGADALRMPFAGDGLTSTQLAVEAVLVNTRVMHCLPAPWNIIWTQTIMYCAY